MQIDESLIRSVVAQVLAEVGRGANVAPKSSASRYGIFHDVNEAVTAARHAFEQLRLTPYSRPAVAEIDSRRKNFFERKNELFLTIQSNSARRRSRKRLSGSCRANWSACW